ncbi:SpaH/EbpB family LPXTG-anchored major pilin [Corynebacterium pseudotuberculosis]|uniref:SpaH/EbpB family LPXTG-anchored major pilin n=1 Tax=Corynebacterium pseudotuberculosis TaxID=1719 RepID=UPI000719236F|nr:SpaH/EbpB family LPXTG-anchored major pilin [Corynebacterium pseudotuberculosis]ALP33453.1 Collagen-binding surface protein Cna-like, B-type domain protein [Corynebacterium pseudotuberculosis]ALU21273.1 fimbrial protein [Corynebacterium pseudotuberculosis]ANH23494.1 Collagen-binding surface protein Cna-like, B-type domain protein [Corynebacterium pseudotuberculosis]APX36783.1 fimbrial protein [Corynebacterium pseudotuberculosis]APX38333.1 fimbrial protein [Corynebacterium pseudotuberculosis
MNRFSCATRSVTFAAIVGLSLGLGGAPAVVAQDILIAAPVKANIDFERKGSLTLYKKSGAESGEHATGHLMENVPGKPLNGVKFKATKINVDLKTDDWAKFPKNAEDAKNKLTTVTYEQTTTGEGVAKFGDLPLGLYLVEETEAPEGVVKGAPFIVSIPMVSAASNSWNYEIVAYPKNSETKVEKSVKDADKNIQDLYLYTITADAPNFKDPKKLTKFIFSDKLDDRLENPKATEVKAGDVTLAEGDFTESFVDGLYKVEISEKGLLKVASGVKVSLTFNVARKEVGNSVELVNSADVIFNNPNTEEDITQKTNEVKTYHGKLKIVKKDAKEIDKVLEGATFELYRCEDPDTLKSKISINGQSAWTTGKDGTVTIDGLHVTDVEDNDKFIEKKYCLKETAAPAGYSLMEKPVAFTMTRDELAQVAEGDDAVTLVKKVENVKHDTPNLPMTGGAGIGILAALGALIIGAGAWLARRNSAKN